MIQLGQTFDPGEERGDYRVTLHENTSACLYRSMWDSFPGGPLATPFQSPEFVSAFCKAIAAPNQATFNICEIRHARSGMPILLLPYTVHNRGPIRVASLPDFGLADQNAPVLSKILPVSSADFADVWGQFAARVVSADLIDIPKVPDTIEGRENPLFHLPACDTDSKMYWLDISPSAPQDWKRKSVFKDARAKESKLARLGIDFVYSRETGFCAELFQILREQRNRRFVATGRDNSLETRPGYAAFYDLLCQGASAGGPVVTFCLRSRTELISAYIALVGPDSIHGVLISIGEEEWHRYSPGMVLITKIIDWSEREGLKTVYFGTGTQDYKLRFGGRAMRLGRVIQPLNVKGKAFVLARESYRFARKYGSLSAWQTNDNRPR